MTMLFFQNLLKQAMGLDAASVGISAVERAVQARMRACDLASEDGYWSLVSTTRGELQQLVEAVAVPETWFFRDPRAFQTMARFAVEQWLPRNPEGALRLLSLPSSTGEEPYTMAMALIDAGFPATRFHIDAFDISEKVLSQAREAIYGRNSFRGVDLQYRDRFFTPCGTAYRLADSVRERVRFAQGNMLDPMFGASAEPYDIVFCRNLMIYFDADDQARAVAVLRRMLADDGMLFVGHSESGLLLDKNFESARVPLAFAFRKTDGKHSRRASTAATTVPKRAAARPVPSPAPVRRPAPTTSRRTATAARIAPARNEALLSLDEIGRMADQGQLAAATDACSAYLRWHGPSADALYLLGVISDASGDRARAADCYRKVLYLNPVHHEALAHLALLLEQQGDKDGARRLNARTQRLQQTEGR